MAKIDDLTILLKARDQTSGAFKSLNKRFGKMGGLVSKLAKGLVGIGAAAATGFGAAVMRGQEFVSELNSMSIALGLGKREADALYQILKQSNPAAQIDRVKEGVLTLTEAFFDARAESGPLFDLMKDFGADIDFNIEGPREQLAEFLRVMKQIPDETVRVGGAISVLGGDDAKAFLPLIRNVELLDERIGQLTGSIEDIPNIFSEQDIQALERAKLATDELNAEWELFGKTASVIVAPAIETTNSLFATFIRGARQGLRDFLGEIGLVENRDRITQVNDEMAQTRILIDRLNASIERQSNFTGGLYSVQTAKNIELQRQKVADYTNDLSDLGLELKALTTPVLPNVTAPSIDSPSTSSGLSDSEIRREIEKRKARELAIEEGVVRSLNDERRRRQLQTQLPDDTRLTNILNDERRRQQLQTVLPPEISSELSAANDSVNTFEDSLNSLASSFGTFGNAVGAGNEKAFRSFQQLQIAISTAAAFSAAITAAADPKLQGFAKLAAYTKVLGVLLGGVAQLKSVRLGGSSASASGGGGSTSTTSTATPRIAQAPAQQDQQQNRQLVNITIQGSTDGKVDIEALDEALRQLGKVPGSTQYRLRQVAA